MHPHFPSINLTMVASIDRFNIILEDRGPKLAYMQKEIRLLQAQIDDHHKLHYANHLVESASSKVKQHLRIESTP